MPRIFSSWSALAALAMAALVRADGNFHKVQYYSDNMQSFEGDIIVPPRYAQGTVYLWPGLQPPQSGGVLQPVLDGRNGHWYFGNAYVGANPSQPYGGGVNADVNQKMHFYMYNKNNSGNWVSGVSNPAGDTAEYEFDVGKAMNQALFVAEIYPDAQWDFGNVVFTDVTITALGTDPSWCTSTPIYSTVTPTIEGVSSSVSNGVVSCYIKTLTLAP